MANELEARCQVFYRIFYSACKSRDRKHLSNSHEKYLNRYQSYLHLPFYMNITSTVELQWLEHGWLVWHGCFELVLESLGKHP